MAAQADHVGQHAQVLGHEWQVDLLEKLPLYLLSASHVVVAYDWRAHLPRSLQRPDNQKKHEMS
eukprot:3042671-Karenia_brevis.AAC.1